jgi:chaperonin GroEL (HSP60 family)
VQNSEVVPGMVFKRQVRGDVTKKSEAKVAVYTCAVDIMQTETKVSTDVHLLLLACQITNMSCYS